MPIEIRMPALSESMTEADLIAWLVKPGDTVGRGDVLAEIETDKSTVELEAEVEGIVLELRVAAGTTGVAVGAVLAVLSEGADADAAKPEPVAAAATTAAGDVEAPARDRDAEAASAEEPSGARAEASSDAEAAAASLRAAPPSVELPEPIAPAQRASGEGRPATALARRIADRGGIDLEELRGTGAGGRIVKADVEQALGEPPTPTSERPAARSETRGGAMTARPAAGAGAEAPYTTLPHTRMRRTIARRLGEAKQSIPHFYLRVECEVSALLALRRELNEEADVKVSVNDFVVRAAALALREVPEANVGWTDDELRVYQHVDMAVAVATDGGLVTPVVRAADAKGLRAISEEMRDLASRARAGRLRPDEYQGGTFSVSNLGMYGVDTVFPILNPPQAGILGVGAAAERPVVRDGALAVGRLMVCALSADHRAIDGAAGARFLEAFRTRIESPLEMLL